MKDWTITFAEDLWLKPDTAGAEEAAFIAKALCLRRGMSVLDAPCGAARIAIHLAHGGCVVTGIDLRRSFTSRARARFRREKATGQFVAMDLRKMDFRSTFDAAYSWLGSFGYFSDEENINVLRRYAAALCQGGRLLVDQPNRESLLRRFSPVRQNGRITTHACWNPVTQHVNSDWVVERNGRREHNRMSIRLYTPAQMQRLFVQAGLNVEAMYGSVQGESYARTSKRLIVVGRK